MTSAVPAPWQKPSIGRIVHYRSYGTPGGEYKQECRAAIIAAVVNDTTLDLAVVNPEGLFFSHRVYLDGGPDSTNGGTWHWPERV